ncbi:hypothetical protein ACHAPT_007333 [Fusarium lateritium]
MLHLEHVSLWHEPPPGNIGNLPEPSQVQRPDEDWSGIKDAKARRKLQNRLNVRAHRKRKAEAEAEKTSQTKLGLFGLLKPQAAESAIPMAATNGRFSMNKSDGEKPQHLVNGWNTKASPEPASSASSYFPLCPDHLIPLAQYNIIRASLTNAYILSMLHLLPYEDCAPLRMAMPLFPPCSIPEPSSTSAINYPPSLRPTPLQLSIPHDYWVDLVPDPTLRDNILLAVQDGLVDVVELQADLVGQLCQATIAAAKAQTNQSSTKKSKPRDAPSLAEKGELGMLVWKDPWCAEGYEVTEAFLQRWPFLFKGCWRFLGATNEWRISRGEDPLELDLYT